MSSPHNDFPLLPRIYPYNDAHKTLCYQLLDKKIGPKEAAQFFLIPTIGWHQNLYYSTLQWVSFRNSGSLTFFARKEFQRALGETELDVIPEDLVVVAPTIYIALPESPLRVWGATLAEWRPLAGAFVSTSKVRISYDPTENSWVPEPVAEGQKLGGISILLWGLGKKLTEEASFWISLDLEELRLSGGTVDEYLDRILSEEKDPLKNLSKFCGLIPTPYAQPFEPDLVWANLKRDAKKGLTIVLNLLLYIRAKSSSILVNEATEKADGEWVQLEEELKRKKSVKKIRKAEQKFKKLSVERIVDLGLEEDLPKLDGETLKGYWTPRRLSLSKKLAEATAQKSTLESVVSVIRKSLTEATEAKEIAKQTFKILTVESSLSDVTGLIGNLESELRLPLFWVQPLPKREANLATGNSPQEDSTP